MWGFGQQQLNMGMTDPNAMLMMMGMNNNGQVTSPVMQPADAQQPSSVSSPVSQLPPGYTLVPMAYLQQMQMAITQMYSQITSLTTAQNALQQAFQTLSAQRAVQPSNGMPSLENSLELAKWINERKEANANAGLKRSKGRNLEKRKPGKSSNTNDRVDTKTRKPKRLCKFMRLEGGCTRGSSCPFSHDVKEKLSKIEDLKVYDFTIDAKPANGLVADDGAPKLAELTIAEATIQIDREISVSRAVSSTFNSTSPSLESVESPCTA